jgi:hypothetical protein
MTIASVANIADIAKIANIEVNAPLPKGVNLTEWPEPPRSFHWKLGRGR